MMPPTCITEATIINHTTLVDITQLHALCISASSFAADIYLLAVTYALVFGILSAFVFTILAAATRDLPPREQDIYVVRIERWKQFAERAGMSAQLALLVALSVLGFGTAVRHAHVNVENIAIGGTALVVFSVGFCKALGAHRAGAASDSASLLADGDSERSTADTRVDLLLSQTGPIGNQATIAAGFTFYNVVTFATDIESLPNTSEIRKCLFNLINVSTVAFGILAACLSTVVQIFVTDLKARRASGEHISFNSFLKQIDGVRSMVVYCFSISLVCFITGFGLYGFTKLSILHVEPTSNATNGTTTRRPDEELYQGHATALGNTVHELIVSYASVVCATAALLFTSMLAFWINSMCSMIVDIERLIAISDASTSTEPSTIANTDTSCIVRAAWAVISMACGCQGIEHLGRNDVTKLKLQIKLTEEVGGEPEGSGQHEILQAMLGAFAFRSLFFGGFAYFAIDFLFTPTWTYAPFYTVAMSLSFCCSVVIITINLLYTVQSSRLQTSACRNLFASKMIWPVRTAYAMFLHSVFWQLCGFMMTGRIKDFDYSNFAAPDPAVDFQFFYDLAIPGFLALVIAVATRITVTMKATEISQADHDGPLDNLSEQTDERLQSSKKDNCARMLKRMDASANAASFCAGNVFFEVLFSGMGIPGAVDFPGADDATWASFANHWSLTDTHSICMAYLTRNVKI